MSQLSNDQLRELCVALGWQGGTFHQVLAEIARLRDPVARWPVMEPVGRMGDMAPPGRTHMTVMLDCDGDACVSIWDQEGAGHGARASIEFCTSFGGGDSPETRKALIALAVAMNEDNKLRPRKQWPPRVAETVQ